MAKRLIAITPDLLRSWADNPPRNSDHVPIHTSTLRRLADAIEALERIENPVKWEVEHVPEGCSINGAMVIAMTEKAPYYRQTAREALDKLKAQPDNTRDYCPEKLKAGGCRLHNLHCGYPACNRPPKTAHGVKGEGNG